MRRPFLGKALKFPINGKFEPASGVELVLQDVQMLLLTRPGERVMRPEFGCDITTRIWDNLENVANDGASDIARAIRDFEPRVNLIEVIPSISESKGLVFFRIRMLIREGNVQTNLVFPFKPALEISQR